MDYNDPRQVKQTLERLGFIVEQLTEGVAVTNLSGTIYFTNPAMARMHGYGSCQGLIARNITYFYSDDQIQTELKSMIDTVRDRGHVQQSIMHTRKDGSVFPAQTKMVRLNDEQGHVVGLVVLVTDLNLRTQQQSLTRHIEQLECVNDQLQQQVHELNQALQQDSEEPVSFDPDEHFGTPLSIRRRLAAAMRHPSQRQRSDTPVPVDPLDLNEGHLTELSEVAKLLEK